MQAPDDLRRGDNRIVGAERLRRVSGRPAHSELRPVRALLVDHHREAGSGGCRDLEPARLGQHVVGVHGVALVLDQPLRAPCAQRLLVGDGEVGERSARLEAGIGKPPERQRHGRGLVEHVDSAAPPDEPVDDLGAEGIAAPPVRVHRHDVGVAHEQERRRLRIAALDAGHEAAAAGLGLVTLHVEAGTLEVVAEQVDVLGLLARLDAAVVDALVADQVAQEVDRLGGGVVGAGAHSPTLGRSGRGSDRVDQPAVLTVALGAPLEHEVLEVGERLALGHHTPVLPREQLV